MDIHGINVILRPIKPKEKYDFRSMVTGSSASYFWYGNTGNTRTEEEFFTDWKKDFFNGKATEKGCCFWIMVENTRIGEINYGEINLQDKKTSIDILIADSNNRGKGYGTDAIRTLVHYLFEYFKLNKIWTEVRTNNTTSIKTFEKVGFKKEGLLKEEDYIDGEFLDAIRFRLLKGEFTSISISDIV